MNIFIAGARSVTCLDSAVREKMYSIYQKGYHVLVGDCYGVDSAVQKFYSDLGYGNVAVYASNGKARNNIGRWRVTSVPVPEMAHGFSFYRQKDIAMANDADYGLMVWDCQSKGTLNNIVSLVLQDKPVAVYLTNLQKMVVLKNIEDVNTLMLHCPRKTRTVFSRIMADTCADRQIGIPM